MVCVVVQRDLLHMILHSFIPFAVMFRPNPTISGLLFLQSCSEWKSMQKPFCCIWKSPVPTILSDQNQYSTSLSFSSFDLRLLMHHSIEHSIKNHIIQKPQNSAEKLCWGPFMLWTSHSCLKANIRQEFLTKSSCCKIALDRSFDFHYLMIHSSYFIWTSGVIHPRSCSIAEKVWLCPNTACILVHIVKYTEMKSFSSIALVSAPANLNHKTFLERGFLSILHWEEKVYS